MVEYVLLGTLAALLLLLLILRTNTAIVFLALCSGSILLATTGEDASLVATSLTSGQNNSAVFVKLLLLLAPVVTCALMLRKHISKSLIPFAFVPALTTAALAILLTVPLLSEGVQKEVQDTDIWSILVQYQEPVTLIGLVTSIVLIALTVKKPHEKNGKKGHH